VEISNNAKLALRMLNQATRGRFDINMLAGPHNARVRAEIMSTLTGANVSQAKAGIHALWAAFHALAGTPAGCIRHREDEFMEWAAHTAQKPDTRT
jgi:hypothetical protein